MNNKKFILGKTSTLLVSVVVLLIIAVGGALAILIDATGPVENTFIPSKNQIDITEDFDDKVKENVYFTNNSDFSVYIRATYVANWVDNNGNVYVETPTLKSADSNSMIKTDSWIYNSTDGYWYYTKVVDPSEKTLNFINSMQATGDAPEGYHLEVNVIAESIQAQPATAVESAWGVKVGTDGTLNFQ